MSWFKEFISKKSNKQQSNSNFVDQLFSSESESETSSEVSEYYSVTSLSVSSELMNDLNENQPESYQKVEESISISGFTDELNETNDEQETMTQTASKIQVNYKPNDNYDEANITEETTEDFHSSQIFEYEAHHPPSNLAEERKKSEPRVGDYRHKFNKCLRFFNRLSHQQNGPILPIQLPNKNKPTVSPKSPFKIDKNFNKIELLTKSTNTEVDHQDGCTQTNPLFTDIDIPPYYDTVYDQQSMDPISNDGDSYNFNSESITGAYAVTINNESGEQFASEIQSSDYLTAFRQASVDSLLFALNNLIPQDNELVPKNLYINLSIKCSTLSSLMYQNYPTDPGDSTVQVAHISPDLITQDLRLNGPLPTSSTSSLSDTAESIDSDQSRVYLATPIILHTPTQLNVSNCYSADQPLQTMFIKTSTPVHTIRKTPHTPIRPPETQLVRRCISDVQEPHSTISIIPNENSNNKTLDQTIKPQPHNCTKSRPKTIMDKNKRIYLSLYNLTCNSMYQQNQCDKTHKSSIQNPAYIFFNNAKSYCSLKETDLDTGKEVLKTPYKETDLDTFNFSMAYTSKSYSLSDVLAHNRQNQKNSSIQPKSQTPNPNTSRYFVEFDDNLLNNFSSPLAQHTAISSSSLASRLYQSAYSAAQLRVAKSITKLNIPSWLDSVEFHDKKPPQINSLSLPSSATAPNTPYNSVKNQKLRQSYTMSFSSSNTTTALSKPSTKVTLPSLKYASKASKNIQPILETQARKILNKSKSTKPDSNSKMHELSQLILSDFQSQTYSDFRDQQIDNDYHSGRVCGRILCSNLIQENSWESLSMCDYCSTVYCSYQCHYIDKLAHKPYCDFDTYLDWLEFIGSCLTVSQIENLYSLFKLGWSDIGKGIIKWQIDEQESFASLEAPFYMKLTKTELSEYHIKQNLNMNFFPISFVSLRKTSTKPLTFTKYLMIPKTNDKKQDCSSITNSVSQSCSVTDNMSSDSDGYKRKNSSKLSILKRQQLVSKIKADLTGHSVNIYSNYPHITKSLNHYLVNGHLFEPHQIFLPGSNSLITVKPDHDIELTELL